jgi:hypothetical protein
VEKPTNKQHTVIDILLLVYTSVELGLIKSKTSTP